MTFVSHKTVRVDALRSSDPSNDLVFRAPTSQSFDKEDSLHLFPRVQTYEGEVFALPVTIHVMFVKGIEPDRRVFQRAVRGPWVTKA